MNSVVTFTSAPVPMHSNWDSERSSVVTKLKNLKVGKKYVISFYVASTSRNLVPAPFVPACAKKIAVTVSHYGGFFTRYVDLSRRKAEWVKVEIELDATHTEEKVYLSAECASGEYTYGHVFVDRNSIKQVN
jgi:hypothetical protein